MDEPLPVGLGLRVPPTSLGTIEVQPSVPMYHQAALIPPSKTPNIAADGLCEFDELDLNQVRTLYIYSYLLHSDPSIR